VVGGAAYRPRHARPRRTPPTTTHDEQPAEPVRIDADGKDWEWAKTALKEQVPEGHELLYIIVGE